MRTITSVGEREHDTRQGGRNCAPSRMLLLHYYRNQQQLTKHLTDLKLPKGDPFGALEQRPWATREAYRRVSSPVGRLHVAVGTVGIHTTRLTSYLICHIPYRLPAHHEILDILCTVLPYGDDWVSIGVSCPREQDGCVPPQNRCIRQRASEVIIPQAHQIPYSYNVQESIV